MYTAGRGNNHDGQMTLTERVRLTRRKTELSQTQLAKLIGVNRSAVANWENDRLGGPCHDNLVRLAKIAHVSIEWLATGRGEIGLDSWLHDPPPMDAALVDEPDELRLLDAWRACSPKARVAALELVEELAHKRHGGNKPFARAHDGMTAPRKF